MSVKFNSNPHTCCFDADLSPELISKCKKSYISSQKKLTEIFFMHWYSWGGGGIFNWCVWFVPDFDFKKVEGMHFRYCIVQLFSFGPVQLFSMQEDLFLTEAIMKINKQKKKKKKKSVQLTNQPFTTFFISPSSSQEVDLVRKGFTMCPKNTTSLWEDGTWLVIILLFTGEHPAAKKCISY